jgi:hypothetical protein
MSQPAFLLAYFRQVYGGRVEVAPDGSVVVVPLTGEKVCDETLHLAWSHDGLHWTPLNDNRSVLPDLFVRDPFVARGPDGLFHLVGTGGGDRRGLVYTRSADLLNWEPPRTVPVMASVERARNVWAPEWLWDEGSAEYFVYWSSSFGEHGWDDSRIWCARTPDWETWTTPRVLFDPGYTVIDATIVRGDDGRFYMAFKDERFGHKHGGEFRFIKVSVSDKLSGPYETVTDAVTPRLTEGPAVFRPAPGGPWHLVCDHCMANGYGAFASDDLLSWRPVEDAAFPYAARHGSVLAVSEDELAALRGRWG